MANLFLHCNICEYELEIISMLLVSRINPFTCILFHMFPLAPYLKASMSHPKV